MTKNRNVQKELVKIMRRAGIPPEFIYAYEQTGILVMEEGYKSLSAEIAQNTTPPSMLFARGIDNSTSRRTYLAGANRLWLVPVSTTRFAPQGRANASL